MIDTDYTMQSMKDTYYKSIVGIILKEELARPYPQIFILL